MHCKSEFVYTLDDLPAKLNVVKADGAYLSGILTVEEGDRLTLTIGNPPMFKDNPPKKKGAPPPPPAPGAPGEGG